MSTVQLLKRRLAHAMAAPPEAWVCDPGADFDTTLENLSERDQMILRGVVRRISEIEADQGPRAAEAAAERVLQILTLGQADA